MEQYYLGFDAGTQSVKTAVYDIDMNLIVQDTNATILNYPHPGWVEMDADQYLHATVTGIRNFVTKMKEKYHLAEPYFLYLGTLEPRKNIPVIIRAYAELRKRKGDKIPKLVLAGKCGWGYDAIFALIQELKLEEMVLFPGYVEETDKPAMLRGAVCFLFPSLYEGFGIPPLEAMACGTPVIVSDAASLPEVVGDGGIQVSYDDYEAISNYMELLSENSVYREEWCKAGVEQANAFAWDKSAKRLLTVYDKILKNVEQLDKAKVL